MQFIPLFFWTVCVKKSGIKDRLRAVPSKNILGIDMEIRTDLIDLYVSESGASKFCLSVLTDLKPRGVEDIFIACINCLKGIPKAIAAVFLQTRVQL